MASRWRMCVLVVEGGGGGGVIPGMLRVKVYRSDYRKETTGREKRKNTERKQASNCLLVFRRWRFSKILRVLRFTFKSDLNFLLLFKWLSCTFCHRQIFFIVKVLQQLLLRSIVMSFLPKLKLPNRFCLGNHIIFAFYVYILLFYIIILSHFKKKNHKNMYCTISWTI